MGMVPLDVNGPAVDRTAIAPLEQQSCKLVADGDRQTQRADLKIGFVIVAAQLPQRVERRFVARLEKSKELFCFDKTYTAIAGRLRRFLVRDRRDDLA